MYYTLRCCREIHAEIEISVITPRFRLSTDTSDTRTKCCRETKKRRKSAYLTKTKKKTERFFDFSVVITKCSTSFAASIPPPCFLPPLKRVSTLSVSSSVFFCSFVLSLLCFFSYFFCRIFSFHHKHETSFGRLAYEFTTYKYN